MIKCIGCGSILQEEKETEAGYVDKLTDDIKLCKRCFKIKNYSDCIYVNKDTKDYEDIFNNIMKKKDLVLFLCDILTINESLDFLNNFSGRVILVITKKDLLPKSVKEQKIINYIKDNYRLNILDVIFVSSVKNYNLDLLINKINKYKNSNKVYLVGNTNAGKSTLINHLSKSFGNDESDITTSLFPATTLDLIEYKLNDEITLVDTPGIVSSDSYVTIINTNDLKRIIPKKEIKPRTYQIKPHQSILIDKYARIDYNSNHDNSITIYVSNEIEVSRINYDTNDRLKKLSKKSFDLSDKKDIVINGLCFCKIVKSANIDVYVPNDVKVFERNNLI